MRLGWRCNPLAVDVVIVSVILTAAVVGLIEVDIVMVEDVCHGNVCAVDRALEVNDFIERLIHLDFVFPLLPPRCDLALKSRHLNVRTIDDNIRLHITIP